MDPMGRALCQANTESPVGAAWGTGALERVPASAWPPTPPSHLPGFCAPEACSHLSRAGGETEYLGLQGPSGPGVSPHLSPELSAQLSFMATSRRKPGGRENMFGGLYKAVVTVVTVGRGPGWPGRPEGGQGDVLVTV